MKFIACKDENEWIDCANDWLRQQCGTAGDRAIRLFVPAGDTPRPLYRSWRENPRLVNDTIRFVQIDEILDDKDSPGKSRPFQKFFLAELPMFASRFEFIDSAERGADYAFLGLGMNGHVAFHEPDLPREFYSGCLTLADSTCTRLHVVPQTRAISYGATAFLNTKAIALLVRGIQKKEILKKVLENSSQKYPASFLLDHPKLTIITDF